MTRNLHFVGSVKLEDPTAVFTALGEHVGELAPRYPDGETGERENWLGWQQAVFANHADLEPVDHGDDYVGLLQFRPRAGVDPATIEFTDIGYARVALASYGDFRRLRDAGVVPSGTRFQVSLPTPLAVMAMFIDPAFAGVLEPAYDAAMTRDLRVICAWVPAGDLAIQWDICIEVTAYDGGRPLHEPDPLGHASATAARMMELTDDDTETGVHLCYGDAGHKHIIEPHDLATSVAFANSITASSLRSLAWVHMAVPRDRDDEAYFEPLDGLAIADAELMLGLLHLTDGIDGAQRRIAAAEHTTADFGLATECGFGRRPLDTIPDLLDLHADAARRA